MLAAIIANLQNVQPEPQVQPKLPMVNIDRGGGGQSWPRYSIVDIVGAIAAFQEMPGEHPVTRAARRHRWIGEALPGIKEARDKREAAAFLMGATLADAAAEERHAADDAQRDAIDKLKIEQLIEIIDSVRGTVSAPSPSPSLMKSDHSSRQMVGRGERSAAKGGGGAAAVFIGGLIVGGIVVGVALAHRRGRAR